MTPLFANLFSPPMLIFLGILGVLIFGRRLPEIGRSLGKTIVEFKKGMTGLEDDLDVTAKPTPTKETTPESVRPPQRVGTTAPKFEEPPTSQSPQA